MGLRTSGFLGFRVVPFWVPDIIRHLLFKVPKKGTLILTTTHIWTIYAQDFGRVVWLQGRFRIGFSVQDVPLVEAAMVKPSETGPNSLSYLKLPKPDFR